MARQSEKFKRNADKAVIALLSKPSIHAAAKAVGIGERTLWRWLKKPEFKKAYQDAKSQVAVQAIAQVQAAMTEAVQTLREVMTNEEAPCSARVTSAKAIIDMGVRALEIEELQTRIEALEEAIEARNNHQRIK